MLCRRRSRGSGSTDLRARLSRRDVASMACNLDLNSGALAATAAHADENRADDRGGRDQAGVERFHRHRRARERSDQSRRRRWILRPAPGSAAGCVHCEMLTEEEQESGEHRGQIQGRRRFAPPVAYPNTQEMSSRSTTPTTRAAEGASSNAYWQNGFLVSSRVRKLANTTMRVRKRASIQVFISTGNRQRGAQGRGHHPFAAWCRSMRSKADRASWAVYSWSGSRQ